MSSRLPFSLSSRYSMLAAVQQRLAADVGAPIAAPTLLAVFRVWLVQQLAALDGHWAARWTCTKDQSAILIPLYLTPYPVPAWDASDGWDAEQWIEGWVGSWSWRLQSDGSWIADWFDTRRTWHKRQCAVRPAAIGCPKISPAPAHRAMLWQAVHSVDAQTRVCRRKGRGRASKG